MVSPNYPECLYHGGSCCFPSNQQTVAIAAKWVLDYICDTLLSNRSGHRPFSMPPISNQWWGQTCLIGMCVGTFGKLQLSFCNLCSQTDTSFRWPTGHSQHTTATCVPFSKYPRMYTFKLGEHLVLSGFFSSSPPHLLPTLFFLAHHEQVVMPCLILVGFCWRKQHVTKGERLPQNGYPVVDSFEAMWPLCLLLQPVSLFSVSPGSAGMTSRPPMGNIAPPSP